jgi:hypothetical protein
MLGRVLNQPTNDPTMNYLKLALIAAAASLFAASCCPNAPATSAPAPVIHAK